MLSRDLLPLINEAASRVYAVVRKTPLVRVAAAVLEQAAASAERDAIDTIDAIDAGGAGRTQEAGGAPAAGVVYAKLEQQQVTGSFKLRGAANKLMSLGGAAASAGVIASSTGNHGLGVAAAARHLGIDAEVFVSEQVSTAKREKILALGARVCVVGADALAAETTARAAAARSGRTYVSPYNDPYVIAGQGTIAVELLRQMPDLQAIYVAVGGGGLISGIGAYLRHAAPQIEIIGCWPENSAVLYECLRAGRIIDVAEAPTFSESTAGGVEEGSITFELCRAVMHRALLVSEARILRAMRWARAQGWAVEGASGVALAAYFADAARQANRRVAVLNCGGNPSPAVAALLT